MMDFQTNMNLYLQNICVKYEYKTVLNNISLNFKDGQIHFLLGENGAGKSTLAGIICGDVIPTSGILKTDTKTFEVGHQYSPSRAIKNGIVCVHQHPMLAESLTIYENLQLGLKTKKHKNSNFSSFWLGLKKNDIKTSSLLKKWLPETSPSTLIKDTGGDGRFFTALVSALLKNPSFLILDEPTALLDSSQKDFLFKNLQEYAKNGMNILIISHFENEAVEYADTITVLEEGQIKLHTEEKISEQQLASVLLKKNDENDIKQQDTKTASSDWKNINTHKKNFIKYSNLNAKAGKLPGLYDLTFSATGGEITLLSGLPEDGLTALENIITGMCRTPFWGTFEACMDGITKRLDLSPRNYNARVLRKKLLKNITNEKNMSIRTAIIPSDRLFRSADPELTIRELLFDSPMPAEKLIQEAQVNINPDEKVKCLSGGMLQRLILQRELSYKPQLLILCEPLQGLDIAATEKICGILTAQAKNGCLILILASSFPENICHKIYRLKHGKLTLTADNSTAQADEAAVNQTTFKTEIKQV